MSCVVLLVGLNFRSIFQQHVYLLFCSQRTISLPTPAVDFPPTFLYVSASFQLSTSSFQSHLFHGLFLEVIIVNSSGWRNDLNRVDSMTKLASVAQGRTHAETIVKLTSQHSSQCVHAHARVCVVYFCTIGVLDEILTALPVVNPALCVSGLHSPFVTSPQWEFQGRILNLRSYRAVRPTLYSALLSP